jgi:hypothetical protein
LEILDANIVILPEEPLTQAAKTASLLEEEALASLIRKPLTIGQGLIFDAAPGAPTEVYQCSIQEQATEAYRTFKANPHYPGLHFKRLETRDPFWSVRIGAHYRAVGLWEGDTIYWFFIGTHEDFNHLF